MRGFTGEERYSLARYTYTPVTIPVFSERRDPLTHVIRLRLSSYPETSLATLTRVDPTRLYVRANEYTTLIPLRPRVRRAVPHNNTPGPIILRSVPWCGRALAFLKGYSRHLTRCLMSWKLLFCVNRKCLQCLGRPFRSLRLPRRHLLRST